MRLPLRSFASDRSGSVILIASGLMVAMTGIAALTVDLGHAYFTKAKLKQIADTAATSAVLTVRTKPSEAAAKALEFVNLNKPSNFGTVSQSADIRIGKWDTKQRTFTATNISPNAIEVTTRRSADAGYGNPLKFFFGPVLGTSQMNLKVTSIATVFGTPNCTIVLDPSASSALDVSGSGKFRSNCPLQVNSTSTSAATTGGAASVITGGTCVTGRHSGSFSPAPKFGATDCPPVEDPMESIPEPVQPAACATPATGASTMAPNCTYTGTIRLSGNINLSPGLYYFKSAQLTLHSSAVITGTGVQIYLDDASNIDLSGGASLNLKAPETGATAGILIFGARGATGGQIHLGGSSNVSLNGTLYTPASTLHLRGNATFTQDGRTGTIITRLLRVTGSSDFIVNGFGTAGVQAKSTIVRSSLVW